ncbi:MAG: hypothetical protein ACLFTV_17435, partial [Desulfococcaceae bacterium]
GAHPMTTHICISTQNQAANLLPALQLKADGMILLSSSEADKRGWTANMKRVCDRRNLPLRIVRVPRDAEDAADRMAATIQPHLPGKDATIFWNMTGGKKSMTLGILSPFLRRGVEADRLIYTDNRPHRIMFYDHRLELCDETPMDHFLELEDLLNLNGFSAGGTGERLSEAEFGDWTAPFVAEYRTRPLFQEMAIRTMDKGPPQLDTQTGLREHVRRLLETHRPRYEKLLDPAPEPDDHARGNLRKAILDLRAEPERKDLEPIIRHCNFFFWNQAKKRLVPELAGELAIPTAPIFSAPLSESESEELERSMAAAGVSLRHPTRGLMRGNILFPDKFGSVLETATAWSFREALTAAGLERFLPHVFRNVKTYTLAGNGDQADDEIDLAAVTPWGALLVFEVKGYYGEGGDVLRRRRDTAYTKSGIFGRAIFIDPLLASRRDAEGNFEDFFPSGLVENHRQIEATRGLQAWCFDEIGTRLPGLLATEKRDG